MSIKINTPAIKIVKSTFTRVVRLIIVSRWQPLLLQFQTTEAVTRLQIRIYNANLWTAGAAEIKMHYTAHRVASIGLDSLNTGTVQLWATYVVLAVGLSSGFSKWRSTGFDVCEIFTPFIFMLCIYSMGAQRPCFMFYFIFTDLEQKHKTCLQPVGNHWQMAANLVCLKHPAILCRPFDQDCLKPVTGAQSIAIRETW